MPTPLFILGKHRSGTTFLSNLLMDHPKIAAIFWVSKKDNLIGGIAESGFFQYIDGRYDNLESYENYIEFASVLSQAQYFKLAGSSIEEILSFYPADYPTVFRKIMDRYADNQNAAYWMEKTPAHTLKADIIKSYYPDAKFIGIIRDEVDSGISSLHLKNLQDKSKFLRIFLLLFITFRKYFFDKTMLKLKKKFPDDVLILSYENLVDNNEKKMTELCQFLGVEKKDLRSDFRKNTSFTATSDRTIFLYEIILIRL
ncbi:MAG: sulfotransferase family protein, partial [Planctomycetota bacterium]